jgi:hypothetical protein
MGGLYGSFWGKLLEPGGDLPSNTPGGALTALRGRIRDARCSRSLSVA